MKKTTLAVALATVLAGASASAWASLVTFTGQDQGTPVFAIPANSVSAAKKAAFVDTLVQGSITQEGFESFTPSMQPPLSILGGKAGLTIGTPTQRDRIESTVCDVSGTCPGRFNTTVGGSNWWQASGSFDVVFAQAISAFGFYATDLFDFGGTLSIALLNGNTSVRTFDLEPSTGAGNGSLLFWGFVDDTDTYTAVRFNISQASSTNPGVIGFDDFTIGAVADVPPNPTPEPASLALVGLALAGLGFARRRRG